MLKTPHLVDGKTTLVNHLLQLFEIGYLFKCLENVKKMQILFFFQVPSMSLTHSGALTRIRGHPDEHEVAQPASWHPIISSAGSAGADVEGAVCANRTRVTIT